MFEELNLRLKLMLLMADFVLLVIGGLDARFIVLPRIGYLILTLLDHVLSCANDLCSALFLPLDVLSNLSFLCFFLFNLLEQ